MLLSFSTPAHSETELPEVQVDGRSEDLIGITDSATSGTVGADELQDRPIQRPGEVVETVPGMVITQHAGGGKANQYHLRSFQIDHGTDFAFYVDGVPINSPSHAHGQGYADLNWLIPELISKFDYKKGVYYADQGDFGNTGAANIRYAEVLPESFIQIGGGTLGYMRALTAGSPSVEGGHLLYGLEAEAFDGAWSTPDELHKLSGVLKYSRGNEQSGFNIEALVYIEPRFTTFPKVPDGLAAFEKSQPSDLASAFVPHFAQTGSREHRPSLVHHAILSPQQVSFHVKQEAV